MKQLDANSLVAYVDGELDMETAALVEAQLAEDMDASELAGRLRETAALVRAAHTHVLHEAVPDRLLDIFDAVPVTDDLDGDVVPAHLVNMILGAPEDDKATDGAGRMGMLEPARDPAPVPFVSMARRRSLAAFATAALLATVLVGGGMVFEKYKSSLNQPELSHQARAVSAMDDPWREAAFQEALETKKSENAVIWSNPENGLSGAIVPVKTYRRDDGTFCRAFQAIDTGANTGQRNYGVACREPGEKGRWIKTVEAMSAPGVGVRKEF